MQKQKQDVVICNEDFKNMNYVISNLSVRLIKDYVKIEKLIKAKMENNISVEEYSQQYKNIINNTKIKIKNFSDNFKELYIMNLIYKKIKNVSIKLYDNVSFDSVLFGIINSLEFNTIPSNILNSIIDFDVDSILNKFKIYEINTIMDEEVDIKNKQYMKYAEYKINNYKKPLQKSKKM